MFFLCSILFQPYITGMRLETFSLVLFNQSSTRSAIMEKALQHKQLFCDEYGFSISDIGTIHQQLIGIDVYGDVENILENGDIAIVGVNTDIDVQQVEAVLMFLGGHIPESAYSEYFGCFIYGYKYSSSSREFEKALPTRLSKRYEKTLK